MGIGRVEELYTRGPEDGKDASIDKGGGLETMAITLEPWVQPIKPYDENT